MTAVEFNPRQIAALKFLSENPGAAARDVAQAIEPGSDARGAAQTLRFLGDYIVRDTEGGYTLTRKGKNAAAKL